MLELYEAQADYRRMMEITEGLFETARPSRVQRHDEGPPSAASRVRTLKAPFQRLS